MDKVYCDNKKKELLKRKEELLPLIDILMKRYADKERKTYKNIYEAAKNHDFRTLALLLDLQKSFNRARKESIKSSEFIEVIEDELEKIYELQSIEHSLETISYILEDTSWVRFDGDILITDPCYLISHSDEKHDEKIQFLYDSLELIKDTIYGDWGCITINTDTKETLGTFCADGAMVCVARLEEVRKLNPDYIPHNEATLIKDFHGEIRIVVEEDFFEYEGETQTEYNVHVEGRGNVNFKTFQSSL